MLVSKFAAVGGEMTESDYDYFCRRAEEERAAASRNANPLARRAHLELAERYEDVAMATSATVLQLNVGAGA